jgi:hypothetical protein
MIFISDYLRSHKKEIVDYIQGNYIPANIMGNNTFNCLATYLRPSLFVILSRKNSCVC